MPLLPLERASSTGSTKQALSCPSGRPAFIERGRVGHELPVRHQPEERLGQLFHRARPTHHSGGPASAIVRATRQNRSSASHRLAGVILDEVALLEDRDGVGRQRKRVPWGGRIHGAPRVRMYGREESAETALRNRSSSASTATANLSRVRASACIGRPETDGQARSTVRAAQYHVKSAQLREIGFPHHKYNPMWPCGLSGLSG